MNFITKIPANKIIKLSSLACDNKGVFYYQIDFAIIRKREDFGYELYFITGEDAGNRVYAWCNEVDKKCVLKTYKYEDKHFNISINEFDKKISQVPEKFIDINALVLKAKKLTKFNHEKATVLNIREK